MERVLEPSYLKRSLANLLGLSTMTIATSGPDNEPHAADVYFAFDEQLTLYFFSDASSQHSIDIHRDPRAAITIHADQVGWEQILGLQMRGVIEVISSRTSWQQAWEVYREKFPFVNDLEEIVAVNQMYGFKPGWIRLVDNSQGFGFNQEWQAHIIDEEGEKVRIWQEITTPDKSSRKVNG